MSFPKRMADKSSIPILQKRNFRVNKNQQQYIFNIRKPLCTKFECRSTVNRKVCFILKYSRLWILNTEVLFYSISWCFLAVYFMESTTLNYLIKICCIKWVFVFVVCHEKKVFWVPINNVTVYYVIAGVLVGSLSFFCMKDLFG